VPAVQHGRRQQSSKMAERQSSRVAGVVSCGSAVFSQERFGGLKRGGATAYVGKSSRDRGC
jgi:hypothetical protein